MRCRIALGCWVPPWSPKTNEYLEETLRGNSQEEKENHTVAVGDDLVCSFITVPLIFNVPE